MQNPDKIISNIVEAAISGIKEKKGEDITTLHFTTEQNSFCEYFIICTADSNIQAKAIASSIEDTIREKVDIKPASREGLENAQWVLVNYLDVVVHIFQKEYREFYNLEGLWADAKIE